MHDDSPALKFTKPIKQCLSEKQQAKVGTRALERLRSELLNPRKEKVPVKQFCSSVLQSACGCDPKNRTRRALKGAMPEFVPRPKNFGKGNANAQSMSDEEFRKVIDKHSQDAVGYSLRTLEPKRALNTSKRKLADVDGMLIRKSQIAKRLYRGGLGVESGKSKTGKCDWC